MQTYKRKREFTRVQPNRCATAAAFFITFSSVRKRNTVFSTKITFLRFSA